MKKMHDGTGAITISLTVLLVSAVLLSGLAGVPFVGKVTAEGLYDGQMLHHYLEHTGYSESPAPSTNQTLWTYMTGGSVLSSPAVVDGKVYVGSYDNNIYCFDAATGAIIWNYTTGWGVQATAAVANGRVYIGSTDKSVYCLDATTGAKIWNYTTGDQAHNPTIADGKVYVGSSDDNLYCLSAP